MAEAHIPSTISEAVSEVVDGVTCDLSYIGELADILSTLSTHAEDMPNKIEAVARAIGLLQEAVESRLQQYMDAAHKEWPHG